MPKRIRVLLIIPHLGGGGAEQVTALLARGLSQEKYELHLCLVTQREASLDRRPGALQVHALRAVRVRQGALRLLRLVWRVRPQVILSGMAHLNFLTLLLRPLFPRGTWVLVRQNATVSTSLSFGGQPGYTRLLYKMLYRYADRVICQSRAMAEDLANELDIDWERISVLPNPVDAEGVLSAAKNPDQWDGPGPHLLAVGRLSREKGFDLLLEALFTLRISFPHADLILAGLGPEEATLKAQSRSLGLESAIRFTGYVDPPYSFFPGASVFILPSRHEGMPNALLEALVGGLPIVALPCSGGVVELLQKTPGAWLAPHSSSHALAETLLEALQALQRGQRFSRAFHSAFTDPIEKENFAGRQAGPEFAFEHAIDCYEELIDETCAVTRL